eukprot:scaffold845_cov364-Prasinococcus_capsulatus_cf.AAC.2
MPTLWFSFVTVGLPLAFLVAGLVVLRRCLGFLSGSVSSSSKASREPSELFAGEGSSTKMVCEGLPKRAFSSAGIVQTRERQVVLRRQQVRAAKGPWRPTHAPADSGKKWIMSRSKR